MTLSYRSELAKAMELMASDPNTIFVGQAIAFQGTAMSSSFNNVSKERLLETPVDEELQLGLSLGLGIAGLTPISVFPRWNFLLLAFNQLVNHLDKASKIFNYDVPPKVIIRTSIGAQTPMDPGPQHVGDYTVPARTMAPNIEFVNLDFPEMVVDEYKRALQRTDGVSTVLVEIGERSD